MNQLISEDEAQIANYTIITQSKEIARLKDENEELKRQVSRWSERYSEETSWLEECRKENKELADKLSQAYRDLSHIDNITKEALRNA